MFKFEGDWPMNSPKPYLLQSIADIVKQENATIKIRKGLGDDILSSFEEKVERLKTQFQNKYVPVVAPKNNERIRRQNGAFLILGIDISAPDYYLKNSFNLKDSLSEYVDEGIPRYLRIPAEQKSAILHELDMIGINEAFVYPELEHQTSYIKKRHFVKAGE